MSMTFKGNQQTNLLAWPASYFLQTSSDNSGIAMKNIDKQLKINICRILTTASEDTVNGIIQALKHAGLESLSDLQFVQEEDLILVLKPIQRRKLVKAWQEQSENDDDLSSIDADSVSSNSVISQNESVTTESAPIPPPSLPPRENDDDLSSIDADSVSSNSVVSQNESVTTESAPIPSPSLPSHANDNDLSSTAAGSVSSYISTSQNASVTTESVVIPSPDVPPCTHPPKILKNLPSKKLKWELKDCFRLMKIFKKYKKEFSSCPDIDQKKVWVKIADEAQQICSINCDELQCLNKINELRCQYERIKSKIVITPFEESFLTAAKIAFKDTENSVIFPAAESINSPAKSSKFNKNKQIKLLQIYAKYKREFSDSAVEEQIVWKKIADEFRNISSVKFDEIQCHNKIDELRDEYEKLKNKKSCKTLSAALFFDTARECFETTKDTINLSAKQSSTQLLSCKSLVFRSHLLEVYAKYKAEFDSPDIEESTVWKKIATELKEIYRYDCGETVCQIKLRKLKKMYEDMKCGKKKKENNLKLFKEAQNAFENQDEMSEAEKVLGRYRPPHKRNMENKLGGPTESLKTIDRTNVVKVSNLSKEVSTSALEELFMPFGEIADLYTIKSEVDESKCIAHITFLKQEDATEAILGVDGIEFNEFILKVEWADQPVTENIDHQIEIPVPEDVQEYSKLESAHEVFRKTIGADVCKYNAEKKCLQIIGNHEELKNRVCVLSNMHFKSLRKKVRLLNRTKEAARQLAEQKQLLVN